MGIIIIFTMLEYLVHFSIHSISTYLNVYVFILMEQMGIMSWNSRLWFTMWGVSLTLIYNFIKSVEDLTNLLSRTKTRKIDPREKTDSGYVKFMSLLFSTAFISEFIIVIVFWSIYNYEPTLIIPKNFHLPATLNHLQHTYPLVCLTLEVFLLKFSSKEVRLNSIRVYKGREELAAILMIGLSYISVIMHHVLYKETHGKMTKYPYPFMQNFNDFQLALFFLVMILFGGILWFLTKKFREIGIIKN